MILETETEHKLAHRIWITIWIIFVVFSFIGMGVILYTTLFKNDSNNEGIMLGSAIKHIDNHIQIDGERTPIKIVEFTDNQGHHCLLATQKSNISLSCKEH